MREVELKALVPDLDAARECVRRAGGVLVFAGRLEDRRYDTPDRGLAARDHVLRLRVYRAGVAAAAETAAGALLAAGRPDRALLDWKGPTQYDAGYKVREELSTGASDPETLALLLERLGYVVTREIDREIEQYELHGATVRFERYPRMDVLVEVEGLPEGIEAAIKGVGLPRSEFTAERLPAFVARFQARTGERAALCDRELTGDFRFRTSDA
jgi:adenylate cyclase class IV